MSKLLNDRRDGGDSRTMEMRDRGTGFWTLLVVAGWLDWVMSEIFSNLNDRVVL